MPKLVWPTETVSSGGKARVQRRIARAQRNTERTTRTEMQVAAVKQSEMPLQHKPFSNIEQLMRSGTSACF